MQGKNIVTSKNIIIIKLRFLQFNMFRLKLHFASIVNCNHGNHGNVENEFNYHTMWYKWWKVHKLSGGCIFWKIEGYIGIYSSLSSGSYSLRVITPVSYLIYIKLCHSSQDWVIWSMLYHLKLLNPSIISQGMVECHMVVGAIWLDNIILQTTTATSFNLLKMFSIPDTGLLLSNRWNTRFYLLYQFCNMLPNWKQSFSTMKTKLKFMQKLFRVDCNRG